jgi:hypothetical protein
MQHRDDSFTFSSDGDDRWIVETSRGWATVTMLGNGQCRVAPYSWFTPAVLTVQASITDVLDALQRLVAADLRAYAALAPPSQPQPGMGRGRIAQLVRGLALATAGLVIAGLVIAAVISGQLA